MAEITSFEKAKAAVKILDSKKAKNIELLKVEGLTILADYFIICSADSSTLVRALADTLEDEFDKKDIKLFSREGKDGLNWLLMDYGDVIVHIFYQESREFYSLEKLWSDAENIDIEKIINE